jgi:hypothetical protein
MKDNRCQGIKANGERCGRFRVSSGPWMHTPIKVDDKWWCPTHRDQEER